MDNTKCVICGKEIPIARLKKHKTTCSRGCAQKLRYQNPEELNKFKAIMKNVMANQEVRNKISTTLKQSEHLERQQRVQKELCENKEAQEKKSATLKQTWQTKDRQEHGEKVKQGQKEHNAIEKISEASIEHWKSDEYRNKVIAGLSKAWTSEKCNRHSIILTNTYKSSDIRQNVSTAVTEALAKPEIKAKHKAGIRRALETEQMHIKLSESARLAYEQKKEQILQKRNETKRRNNSFHTSKPEAAAKLLLEKAFPDVQYQYRSKEYPFNCDFYVPSLDLYIELNYHWTHGPKPYDENDIECQERLQHLMEKAKTSRFYQNAIDVWTGLDVRKRQCVVKNNLNYLAFYSIEDFEQWLNSLL